jgi:hypothetical protein
MSFALAKQERLRLLVYGTGPRQPRRWDAFVEGVIELGGTRFCPDGLALAILGVANKTIREMYGREANLGCPEAKPLIHEQIPAIVSSLALDPTTEQLVRQQIQQIVAIFE